MAEEKPKVLIVDDEMIIREGCDRALSKDGYQVLKAENGREGLDLLIGENADIMLLDLKMPVMDGMTVLKEVAERELKVLIIIITGHGTIETAVQSMKSGAYDFITKPFMPDQLRFTVSRAWEKIRLEREAAYLREERVRSLRDIATEKSRISTIIQAMTDGVIIADSNCEIILNNAPAARLLGLRSKVLLGEKLLDATGNDMLADMVQQVLELSDSAVTSITKEMELREEIYVRASAGLVKDEEGTPMGTVTVLQDIGYLKQIEKMKSNFVAMVAHELRAPLAAVLQNMDLLLSQSLGPVNEAQQNALERVSVRSTGLLRLVNSLLDLSKIEAGTLVLNKEQLDMRPIIDRVADMMRVRAVEKGCEIVVELPEHLPLILADPLHMEGVVTNLISNAVRYNREGGIVRVCAGRGDDSLVIQVSDTGIGMSKEDLPKIFDRFYRIRSDKTRKIGGTGLGLHIVKGIVDAHLGSIKVESEPDRGTTFRIRIPSII